MPSRAWRDALQKLGLAPVAVAATGTNVDRQVVDNMILAEVSELCAGTPGRVG